MKKKSLFILLAIAILGALLAGSWWSYLQLFEEPPIHEALVATACDPGQTAGARGKAVCRLFADYVPPNSRAATIHKVFGDCEWLGDTRVYVYGIAVGPQPPLRIVEEGETFRLDLFTPDRASDWTLYGRFDTSGHAEDDVRRFFNPKIEPKASMRLVEFAISDFRRRKTDVFDITGRHPPRYN